MSGDIQYSNIRFIGYAIPTTPAELVSIGDPNGPGAVAGVYLGDEDTTQDYTARIDILKTVVDQAKEALKDKENEGVINLFVAPEFYFHGPNGPYLYQDDDQTEKIMAQLAATFNQADYPNWIFVCGSVVSTNVRDPQRVSDSALAALRNNIVHNLSTQWLKAFGPMKLAIMDMLVNFIKVCHSYPLCEVRNRTIVINNLFQDDTSTPYGGPAMSTEKYYVSNEDFILYNPVTPPEEQEEGLDIIITEQMVGYPALDLSGGDFKEKPDDPYAIFRQRINDKVIYMDLGIEICLDHSDARLRRNLSTFSTVNNGGVHVQIIPSCGMQINSKNVAADHDGFVFNCDGQYALSSGDMGVFASYTCPSDNRYAAHTQLARVDEKAEGDDPVDPLSKNATFKDISFIEPEVLEVPGDVSLYFAGGPGAIHIYGFDYGIQLYG